MNEAQVRSCEFGRFQLSSSTCTEIERHGRWCNALPGHEYASARAAREALKGIVMHGDAVRSNEIGPLYTMNILQAVVDQRPHRIFRLMSTYCSC